MHRRVYIRACILLQYERATERKRDASPRTGTTDIIKEVTMMIIAVDFDGVLCDNDFPGIGLPKYEVISLVRQLIDLEQEVILWTSRTDAELESAVKWCGDYGLHFCAVNENAPSNIAKYREKYPNGTRKVFADVYVDDHSLGYVTNRKADTTKSIIAQLSALITIIKSTQEEKV